MKRPLLGRVLWTLVVALPLAGCTDNGLHVVPRDERPADLYGRTPSAVPPPTTTTRLIYLTKEGRLVPVSRTRVTTGDRLESAVRSLLAGPTEQEAQTGVGTVIPPDADWIDGSVSESVASVNLSSAFELGAEQRVLTIRMAQLVFTVTELPGISAVRLLIDGEPIDVVVDGGRTRSEAVTRADYESVSPL